MKGAADEIVKTNESFDSDVANDPALRGGRKPMKCGYLQRYQRRLLGKNWKDSYVVLYDDSTIAWYKNQTKDLPVGGILLQDAPELMAVGAFTLRVPTRPDLPGGQNIKQLMAFGVRNKRKVHWFLARTEHDANDWMTAISNTLPIPPEPVLFLDTDENIYETIDIEKPIELSPRKNTDSTAKSPKVNDITSTAKVTSFVDDADIAATTVLLSTGAWGYGSGWGCGSGWGNYNLFKTIDDLGLFTLDNSASSFQYDDYNDSEFDADFGGDFSF
ncbi:uncharacterized protein LOC136028801 isoform X2 [Artemia franciscana]|uniref:PH domain-containing protein n=1 Tax=Artemia franciscana TaxID=6661 RepID=A0AA88HEA1_ARTSF|nr:hypothetical protein QYM36_015133 [Artemia franciscana]